MALDAHWLVSLTPCYMPRLIGLMSEHRSFEPLLRGFAIDVITGRIWSESEPDGGAAAHRLCGLPLVLCGVLEPRRLHVDREQTRAMWRSGLQQL